jgi:hypothetical protein
MIIDHSGVGSSVLSRSLPSRRFTGLFLGNSILVASQMKSVNERRGGERATKSRGDGRVKEGSVG